VLLCRVVYTNKLANNLIKIELYTIFSLSKHKMESVLCEFLLIKFSISANRNKLSKHKMVTVPRGGDGKINKLHE